MRKIQFSGCRPVPAPPGSPHQGPHHIIDQIAVAVRRHLAGKIVIKNLHHQKPGLPAVSRLNGVDDLLLCLQRIIIVNLQILHIVINDQIRIQKNQVGLQLPCLQIR